MNLYAIKQRSPMIVGRRAPDMYDWRIVAVVRAETDDDALDIYWDEAKDKNAVLDVEYLAPDGDEGVITQGSAD